MTTTNRPQACDGRMSTGGETTSSEIFVLVLLDGTWSKRLLS